jgi:hypothetical protein
MRLLNYLTVSTVTNLRQWIFRSNALYSSPHVEEQISGRQEKEIFWGRFVCRTIEMSGWKEGWMD